MLQFNELRIDSSKHLIIDVSVITTVGTDPNQAVYIDRLLVGFGTNCESECINFLDETVIAFIQNSQTSCYAVLEETGDGNQRPRHIVISLDLLDKDLMCNLHISDINSIIYVLSTVDDSEVTQIAVLDCHMVTRRIEGYVYDKCKLAENVFDYLKSIDNYCNDREISNLANYIARIKGLELAIENSHFALANKYWNKFFNISNTRSVTFNTGCGCRS